LLFFLFSLHVHPSNKHGIGFHHLANPSITSMVTVADAEGTNSKAAPAPPEIQISDVHPDNTSDSDYHSFSDDSDNEEIGEEVRQHEREMVLEAAGLIVNQEVRPLPRPPKRRPAPAAPDRRGSAVSTSSLKDLPPVPEPEGLDLTTHLDDAFDRYEEFKKSHGEANLKRMSTASDTLPPTPQSATFSLPPSVSREENRSYSNILNFLGRNRSPANDTERPKSTLNISGPILNPSDPLSREGSPAFGTVRVSKLFSILLVLMMDSMQSWASLVDKAALEVIPVGERRRQEVMKGSWPVSPPLTCVYRPYSNSSLLRQPMSEIFSLSSRYWCPELYLNIISFPKGLLFQYASHAGHKGCHCRIC
jgi:hypothetical protein